MNIFKNKVGRPSNKTKFIRRTIVLSGLFVVIAGFFAAYFVLFNGDSNNVKGMILKNGDKQTLLPIDGYAIFEKDKKHEIGNLDVKNGEVTNFTFTKKKDGLKLNCPTSIIVGEQFTCTFGDDSLVSKTLIIKNMTSLTKYAYVDAGDGVLSFIKQGSAIKIGFGKKGYKTVVKNVSIYNPSTIKLNCPTMVNVNESFFCTTNQPVTIRATQTNLISSYKYELKQKATDPIKRHSDSIPFGYESQALGYTKEGEVTIKAFDSNYDEVAVKVKVVKNKTLSLYCPEVARINEVVECATDVEGAVLRVTTDNLDSSYKNKTTVKTNKTTKSIKAKYTKKGYIYVGITKNGYEKVVKRINITNSASAIRISCPKEAKVNEVFKCWVNLNGATLRGSHAGNLAKGYSDRFVTIASKRWIAFKYTKAGTYTIKASKKNYDVITTKVKVVQPKTTTTTKPKTKTTTTTTKQGSSCTPFTLSCPEWVYVNDSFQCSVTREGIEIVASAEGLAQGIAYKYTTTIRDLYKDLNYTTDGLKTIIATDKNSTGCTSAKANVQVCEYYTLTCSTNTAKVNEEFYCWVDKPGSTIRVTTDRLAPGYAEKFDTSSGTLKRAIKYTGAGYIWVTAEKNGCKTTPTKIYISN